jgi:HprK-related kinase A
MTSSVVPPSGHFCALGHRFSIEVPDPALAAYLAGILGHLHENGRASHRYGIDDEGSGDGCVVRFDDTELLSGVSPDLALAHLLWHVNRQAVDSATDHLLLHASAAERDGHAVICPAPMESGKTTLIAGLVRSGWRYLTDEAVAIDPSTGLVQPYPKPLSVDPGSFGVLADLEPALDAGAARWLGTQWHLDPRAVGLPALGEPSRPALVVTPRYEPGCETTLEALDRADALVLLCENSFNLKRFGTAGFRALARTVCACLCYRLRMSDLDTAVTLVDALDPTSADTASGNGTPMDVATGTTGPRRAATVTSVELDGRAVLYDQTDARVHVLNPSAAAVWSCLDGHVTIGDLARELAEVYDEPVQRVDREIIDLVRQLESEGLITSTGSSSSTGSQS